MNIDTFIKSQLSTSADLRATLAADYVPQIRAIALAAVRTLLSGKKILLCGNGGSASDAEHIAAEFVGRFRRDRVPLPAIALTANGADLTAIGNDFGFDNVFSRQVYALGQPGDLLIAISTSGRSRNVREAIKAGGEAGMTTVCLTGARGADMAALCDLSLVVPTAETAHIQESHMAVCHLMCEIVDEEVLNRSDSGAGVPRNKLVSPEELLSLRPRWEAAGQTVVWMSGTFDALHVGQLRALRQAKALGHVLVVGVNSDNNVLSVNGAERILIPEAERAELVAALDCVDHVVLAAETTPDWLGTTLKPDVECKVVADSTRPDTAEAGAVSSWGGRIHVFPVEPGYAANRLAARSTQASN